MNNYRDQKKYYPTMVSDIPGQKEIGEGFRRTQIIKNLPDSYKIILLSDDIVDFIYKIENKYGLNDLQTEDFSRLIRRYFFKEISENDFIYKISLLCDIRSEEAIQILRAILSITPQSSQEVKSKKKNLMHITLANAFSQFPAVKNQMISDKPIITKPFLQPLQPSIKNWIMVYEKILGANKHNAIERGEFVFRSEATRGLTPQERAELAGIFRSRDEDSLITVDMDQRKIVFDEAKGQIEPSENKRNIEYDPPKITYQSKQQQPVIQVVAREDVMDKSMEMPETLAQKSFQREYVAPVYSVAQSALQQEITKNRMEIEQGLSLEHFSARGDMGMSSTKEKAHVQTVENMHAVATTSIPNIQQGINAITPGADMVQNNSAISGRVEFSSNHSLPVEKIEKKSLNPTSDYYQMSPIGGAHVFNKMD
jgi:hypothetical protein